MSPTTTAGASMAAEHASYTINRSTLAFSGRVVHPAHLNSHNGVQFLLLFVGY